MNNCIVLVVGCIVTVVCDGDGVVSGCIVIVVSGCIVIVVGGCIVIVSCGCIVIVDCGGDGVVSGCIVMVVSGVSPIVVCNDDTVVVLVCILVVVGVFVVVGGGVVVISTYFFMYIVLSNCVFWHTFFTLSYSCTYGAGNMRFALVLTILYRNIPSPVITLALADQSGAYIWMNSSFDFHHLLSLSMVTRTPVVYVSHS